MVASKKEQKITMALRQYPLAFHPKATENFQAGRSSGLLNTLKPSHTARRYSGKIIRYNSNELTATGIAPDSHRVPYCPKGTCLASTKVKSYLMFCLIFKVCFLTKISYFSTTNNFIVKVNDGQYFSG
jgi:hypothetical protein